MSTDLQDELRRLVDDVGVSSPPRDLWTRGVRRQRRRRATALAVAAVLALVLSATGVVSYDAALSRLEPAQPGQGRAAIPFRVETPSPWTPSTRSNPIGPLAVIGEAPHHHNWFTQPYDIFGVSAGNATYRFLDLPRLAAEPDSAPRAVLSPDGRHVGYWIEGDTPKRQPDFEGTPVAGFASYDTVTGAVTTHPVPTQRGVSPDAMVWVSPSELLVSYGHLSKQPGTGVGFHSYLWQPVRGTLRRVPGSATVGMTDPAPTPSGFASASEKSIDVWTLPMLAERHFHIPVDVQMAIVGPGGRWVAIKSAEQRADLYVGQLTGTGRVRVRPLAQTHGGLFDVLGWTDRRHFVVGLSHGGKPGIQVVSFDVRSGVRTTIGHGAQNYWDYASSLWSRPLAPRPGAPWEINPWWATVGVGFVAYLALCLLWNFRRRRDDTA